MALQLKPVIYFMKTKLFATMNFTVIKGDNQQKNPLSLTFSLDT